MKQFEVILKNEKVKSYRKSLIVIIFLNLFSFLFLAYVTKEKSISNRCIWIAGCIAIALTYDFLIKNKQRVDFRGAAVLLIIFSYFVLGYYFLAISMILITITYLLAIRSPKVYVSTEVISYTTILNKKIKWETLNNILVKDNILTIDFKNNKLIQQSIDEAKSNVNEQEFNDFCRQQLETSNK